MNLFSFHIIGSAEKKKKKDSFFFIILVFIFYIYIFFFTNTKRELLFIVFYRNVNVTLFDKHAKITHLPVLN